MHAWFRAGICAVVCAGFLPGIAYAQKSDVDYDYILSVVDFFLNQEAPGRFGSLRNADRDGNGINEDDQLAMLSAVLLGGSTQIDINRTLAIQSGFISNGNQVESDLRVSISVIGFSVDVDVLNELRNIDPLFASSVRNLLAGYMTVGDAATVNFLRNLLKDFVRFFAEREGYGSVLGLVNLDDVIRFRAQDYTTFGDTRPGQNYLGAGGNISGEGASNLGAYQAASGTFRRENWLTAKRIIPPPRVVNALQGGSIQTGDPFTFAALVAGGGGTLSYQWLRTNSNGREYPSTYDLVGPNSDTYEIGYATALDNADFTIAVSDQYSVYDPVTRTGGRTFPGLARLNVTQIPLQIVTQPLGATVGIGTSYTFNFKVRGGSAVPSYSWTKNGEPLGISTPTLTIDPVTGGASGDYQVTANSAGSVVVSNLVTLNVIGAGDVVTFPDPGLDAAVRDALGFAPTKDIFEGDLLTIQTLDASSRAITDLTNIGKVANLNALLLWDNALSDVGSLADLPNLEFLHLGKNQIEDLTPLQGLLNLGTLLLWDNPIASLSPLLSNTGLGAGDEVGLEGVALTQEQICVEIPQLQALGADVGFDGICLDGLPEGEGFFGEGEGEGVVEGTLEGEGAIEGSPEGEGAGEGIIEGEGEGQEQIPCPEAPSCDLVFDSGPVNFPLQDAKENITEQYVCAPYTIGDVNLTVNITHPRAGTLSGQIEAPSGTRIFVFLLPAGGGANMTGTTFNDELSVSIDTAAAPYTGVYSSRLPLSVFDLQNMQGLWKITIADTVGDGFTGTLNSWSLAFNPCDPEVVEAEGEGEIGPHDADTDASFSISLLELLRVVQLYNSGEFSCSGGTTIDGFTSGAGPRGCGRHSGDYQSPSWRFSLQELLRIIQFFNAGAYTITPGSVDNYSPA